MSHMPVGNQQHWKFQKKDILSTKHRNSRASNNNQKTIWNCFNLWFGDRIFPTTGAAQMVKCQGKVTEKNTMVKV